jgi:hypothetical protein
MLGKPWVYDPFAWVAIGTAFLALVAAIFSVLQWVAARGASQSEQRRWEKSKLQSVSQRCLDELNELSRWLEDVNFWLLRTQASLAADEVTELLKQTLHRDAIRFDDRLSACSLATFEDLTTLHSGDLALSHGLGDLSLELKLYVTAWWRAYFDGVEHYVLGPELDALERFRGLLKDDPSPGFEALFALTAELKMMMLTSAEAVVFDLSDPKERVSSGPFEFLCIENGEWALTARAQEVVREYRSYSGLADEAEVATE